MNYMPSPAGPVLSREMGLLDTRHSSTRSVGPLAESVGISHYMKPRSGYEGREVPQARFDAHSNLLIELVPRLFASSHDF